MISGANSARGSAKRCASGRPSPAPAPASEAKPKLDAASAASRNGSCAKGLGCRNHGCGPAVGRPGGRRSGGRAVGRPNGWTIHRATGRPGGRSIGRPRRSGNLEVLGSPWNPLPRFGKRWMPLGAPGRHTEGRWLRLEAPGKFWGRPMDTVVIPWATLANRLEALEVSECPLGVLGGPGTALDTVSGTVQVAGRRCGRSWKPAVGSSCKVLDGPWHPENRFAERAETTKQERKHTFRKTADPYSGTSHVDLRSKSTNGVACSMCHPEKPLVSQTCDNPRISGRTVTMQNGRPRTLKARSVSKTNPSTAAGRNQATSDVGERLFGRAAAWAAVEVGRIRAKFGRHREEFGPTLVKVRPQLVEIVPRVVKSGELRPKSTRLGATFELGQQTQRLTNKHSISPTSGTR